MMKTVYLYTGDLFVNSFTNKFVNQHQYAVGYNC